MKKLSSLERLPVIIPLGNPGRDYSETRHNVGRIVINEYIKNLKPLEKYRFKSSRGGLFEKNGILFKVLYPSTYMNLSGNAVQSIYAKLREGNINSDILIVHDEIDIPIGRFKFKKTGGSGGHNGIKSIISSLGTKDFNRLRIGIGSEDSERDPDFVLGKFYNSEKKLIESLLDELFRGIDCFLKNGIDIAMNEYNQKRSNDDY